MEHVGNGNPYQMYKTKKAYGNQGNKVARLPKERNATPLTYMKYCLKTAFDTK